MSAFLTTEHSPSGIPFTTEPESIERQLVSAIDRMGMLEKKLQVVATVYDILRKLSCFFLVQEHVIESTHESHLPQNYPHGNNNLLKNVLNIPLLRRRRQIGFNYRLVEAVIFRHYTLILNPDQENEEGVKFNRFEVWLQFFEPDKYKFVYEISDDMKNTKHFELPFDSTEMRGSFGEMNVFEPRLTIDHLGIVQNLKQLIYIFFTNNLLENSS